MIGCLRHALVAVVLGGVLGAGAVANAFPPPTPLAPHSMPSCWPDSAAELFHCSMTFLTP